MTSFTVVGINAVAWKPLHDCGCTCKVLDMSHLDRYEIALSNVNTYLKSFMITWAVSWLYILLLYVFDASNRSWDFVWDSLIREGTCKFIRILKIRFGSRFHLTNNNQLLWCLGRWKSDLSGDRGHGLYGFKRHTLNFRGWNALSDLTQVLIWPERRRSHTNLLWKRAPREISMLWSRVVIQQQ